MKFGERLRALMREPLIHFLIAGLALFFVLGPADGDGYSSREIIVSQEDIARISENWERSWRRPPSEEELERLIDEFVREEIYYREALRLGLDENDTVIRRRLRTKMEFLARAEAENAAADNSVLQSYLDENVARYATGARISFTQIYLGPTGNGVAERERLESGASPSSVGQPLAVPRSLENASRNEISRDFGQQFADLVLALEGPDWQGPVASGFGQHLVRITAQQPGEPPQLSEVRQQVENDWRAETLAQREEEVFETLRENYSIEIAGRE